MTPLSNTRRGQLLGQALDLVRLLEADHTRAVAQFDEWSGGFPSGHEPPMTVPSGDATDDNPLDYSDRTGTLATTRPDVFTHHKRELDRLITLAHTTLNDAYQHMLVGLARRDPTEATVGCKSCARLREAHNGGPLFTPAWRAGLCRWCADWQGRHGAWPAEQILRAHHRGEQITERMVKKYQQRSA